MADGQNTAAFLGLLKGVAPVLGTVLAAGNPLGGAAASAAVDFLAGKLNIPTKTPEAVTEALSQLPAPTLAQLEYEFKQHCEDNQIQLDLGQLEINKQEAKAAEGTDKWWVQLWVAGWRPYIGWICGTAIGYQFLARPLFNGLIVLCGRDASFPALEVQDLIALVMTLLGHGAMRSYDKKNGTASE